MCYLVNRVNRVDILFEYIFAIFALVVGVFARWNVAINRNSILEIVDLLVEMLGFVFERYDGAHAFHV